MLKQKRLLSDFFKMLSGITVEILVTFILMGAVFIAGVLILRWFSR